MKLEIYTKEGILKLSAVPDENSRVTAGIQEESLLAITFTAFECLPLEVYDYTDFDGMRYWVTERYMPQMKARNEWTYSLQLHGVEGLAAQTLIVNTTDGEDTPLVTLTAPAREHAALIVANLNRRMGTSIWKVGEVVASDYIRIEYTGKYASDALTEVAEAADTEWWFDGATLNFSRCEFGEHIDLAYGNGLLGGITRSAADGVKFFTRLFPVGSTRNIDPDRYGHARLQLPGGMTYVEQDTHLGILEHYEQDAFAGIYPRRIGTVGGVRSEEKIGENGEPFTIWYFTDPAIPFNPNESEIGGLVKQVTFQSGELRGRTFEVNYDAENKEFEIITQWPYDDAFQLPSPPLVPATDDEYILWNIRMPDSYYAEAEAEFLTAANAFLAKARKDISVFSAPTDFTVLDTRGISLRPGQRIRLHSDEYFPENGYRNTRIVSTSSSVLNPGEMTITMSDVLSTGRIRRIESDLGKVEQLTREVSNEMPDIIRSWEETPPSDGTVYSSKKSERQFLNKRTGGVVEGPIVVNEIRSENFTGTEGAIGAGYRLYEDANGDAVLEIDKIDVRKEAHFNELVINQISFSRGETVLTAGGFEIIRVEELETVYRCFYDNADHRRYAGIRIDDLIRCQQYDAAYGAIVKYYWRLCVGIGDDYVDLSKNDCDGLGLPATGDNCVQFGNIRDRKRQAAIVLDPRNGGRIEIYQNIESYTLSEKNMIGLGTDPETNESIMYGYGAFYFGDRDTSAEDATYVTYQQKLGDKKKRVYIRGSLQLGKGSSGLTNFSEWADKQQQLDDTQQTANDAATAAAAADRKAQDAKDYIDNTLPKEIIEINKRLDGVVENWFEPYTPSLMNEPALSWAANGEIEQHIGDTFTNTQQYVDDMTTPDAGKSWRWIQSDSGYKWTPIADSDAVKALLDAARAQETADGKNRTFVVRPTPPYSVGDMWVQGAGGEIMRCIVSRETGLFNEADWDKASKYTDDTFAKERFDAMASDGIITKEEKATLRDLMAQIDAEFTKYEADAKTYGVSISDFRMAYTALRSMLMETVLIDVDADSILSSEARKDYNDSFADYYAERNRFANLIARILVSVVQENVDLLSYLKKALTEDTSIEGGLIQSSLIRLGSMDKQNGKWMTKAGTSGIYDPTRIGGGIAAWYGGDMIDMADYYDWNDTLLQWELKPGTTPPDNIAQGVDRMDGTGYRAHGAFWWDARGKVYASPNSFFVGEEAVGNLMALFHLNYKAGASNSTDFINVESFFALRPMTILKVNSYIDLGEARISWDAANKAVKISTPDGLGKMNLYTTGGLSALGLGGVSGDGSGTGGAAALADLLDVSLVSLATDNVLVYDGTHWVNRPMSAIKPDLTAYATKSWVEGKGYATPDNIDARIDAVVAGAPAAFDTLKEIADVLQSNVNSIGDIMTTLASKANKTTTMDFSRELVDPNTITKISVREVNSNTNAPTNGSCHQYMTWGTGDTNYLFQMATTYTDDGRLFYRHKVANAWKEWHGLALLTDISWGNLINKPTNLAGFGLTDEVDKLLSGYLPLTGGKMSNTNIVTNLNADLLDGLHAVDLYGRIVYNFANGVLVKLSTTTTQTNMITIRIIGNSYDDVLPIDTTVQLYNYAPLKKTINCAAVNNGKDFGAIKIFYHDGHVCLWFCQPRDFYSFIVTAYVTNNVGKAISLTTTNTSMPADATNTNTVTPWQSALTTDNVASATDASKLGGQLPAYYATAEALTNLSNVVDTKLDKTTFDDLFEKENVGTVENPKYVIKAKYSLYCTGGITAFE